MLKLSKAVLVSAASIEMHLQSTYQVKAERCKTQIREQFLYKHPEALQITQYNYNYWILDSVYNERSSKLWLQNCLGHLYSIHKINNLFAPRTLLKCEFLLCQWSPTYIKLISNFYHLFKKMLHT